VSGRAPIRVLHVLLSLEPGGLENGVVNVINHLDRDRFVSSVCCLKHAEAGAAEGAAFIKRHIIRVTDKAFDDFAGAETDSRQLRRMLGISGAST